MDLLKNILFIITLLFAMPSLAQEVYKTDTGEKYHKEHCHYLKNSKTKITLKKATQLRLTACKVCKPKKNSNSSSIKKSNNTSTSTTAKQCTGKTKAGRRCKRKTKKPSGTCYQH